MSADSFVGDPKTALDDTASPEQELSALIEMIRAQQNLFSGITGGLIMAILGAVIWATIASLSGYKLGIMSVIIGFMVGKGVRHMGRGIDARFGCAGALLALFGCFCGNLFTLFYLVYKIGIPITSISLSSLYYLLAKYSSPMDIIFYGIAIYEGYKIAKINLSFANK